MKAAFQCSSDGVFRSQLEEKNVIVELGESQPWKLNIGESVFFIIFRIHEATGIDMTTDVYNMLGYDHGENKVKMGVLVKSLKQGWIHCLCVGQKNYPKKLSGHKNVSEISWRAKFNLIT